MSAPVARDRQPRSPFEDRYLAEARRICLEIVPEPYEVFLFGSRARGHCEHSSDIDIGIAGPGPLPGGVSRFTDRLLDSDVPWRPQVVDFALVTDADFRRRAYEEREVWRPANEAARTCVGPWMVLAWPESRSMRGSCRRSPHGWRRMTEGRWS